MTRRLPHRRPLADLQAEQGRQGQGKRADVVVRFPRATRSSFPANNSVHLLVLTMGAGSVDTVAVNDEIVFHGGRSTRVDEMEISRAVSASMAERAGRLGYLSLAYVAGSCGKEISQRFKTQKPAYISL